MATDPFIVHVARLRRNPGAVAHEVRRGPVELAGPLDELGIDPGRSVVPLEAEAECDITLRPFIGGIDAVGTVRAPWVGICRRCAVPVGGELHGRGERAFRRRARSPRTIFTRSWTTPSIWARWCVTPSCSSSPWRPCAGRTVRACARSAGPIATRPTAAALSRWTRVGLTSTCSGS